MSPFFIKMTSLCSHTDVYSVVKDHTRGRFIARSCCKHSKRTSGKSLKEATRDAITCKTKNRNDSDNTNTYNRTQGRTVYFLICVYT